MQKQLSIFDRIKPLDTAPNNIKPGDWVRLTRKSPHAAYWKKGDIVQIEGAHPIDGSVRFWNERANDWAYLHPGDMVKVSAPIAPDPVQPIAPGEGTTPAPDDTESNPIARDTESTQPIALDTESICQPTQSHQSSVISFDAESTLATCENDSVSPQPITLDTESTPAPGEIDSVSGPVSRYKAKGTARGGEYYRFSYRDGKKMKHIHIPGGNTGSALAQQRAAQISKMSEYGEPLQDIINTIHSWCKRVTW